MRILIVDDEAAVHDGYRAAFAPAEDLGGSNGRIVELAHALQGLEAVNAVAQSRTDGDPFAVAFIDIRMPPGIDGRETARRIRALDPDIAIVIVTGLTTIRLDEIARDAGPIDKLFHIAKPFTPAEVRQTAAALAERWHVDRRHDATLATLARRIDQLEVRAAELAANESRALHLATHDSLTDMPNRLAFQRVLGERARVDGDFATVMIDLDRFKLVNDTLGHLAGDALIREIYAILVRSAPADAVVARLGGDEFGILFDTPDEAAADAYDALYAEYLLLHDWFGRGGNDVMHRLRAMRREATRASSAPAVDAGGADAVEQDATASASTESQVTA